MIAMTVIVAALLGGAQPVGPDQEPERPPVTEAQRLRQQEARDRVRCRALVREIRELDEEHERTVSGAMDRARGADDGRASLADQADLLALRDRRDRLMNRLTLLTLRHGWDMPDLDAQDAAPDADGAGGTHEVFAAGAAVLRARFAAEAARAARLVELPVAPLIVER
jgi:hypothetical protein